MWEPAEAIIIIKTLWVQVSMNMINYKVITTTHILLSFLECPSFKAILWSGYLASQTEDNVAN